MQYAVHAKHDLFLVPEAIEKKAVPDEVFGGMKAAAE